MKSVRLSCGIVLASVALLLCTSAPASAEIPFCTFGSGPGQCKEPSGVAVDTSLGRVYVADTGNHRINVYDEGGNFLSSFGSSGSGAGQLTKPRDIAVDNDPTSPAFHDIYVVDSPPDPGNPEKAKPRVQKFGPSGAFVLSFGEGVVHASTNPVAVGPGGTVYVGDDNFKDGAEAIRRIERFTPAGTLIGASNVPESVRVDFLAVDSAGHAYVSAQTAVQGIDKYELSEPEATLLDSFDLGANTTALAVDPAGNLYSAQFRINPRDITKRDSSGNIVRRFGFGEIETNLQGLAVGATGELFGAEQFAGSAGGGVIRIGEPPPGAVSCCLSSVSGNTKASLKGQVNPEGKAATHHFEYLTEADYLANGNSFSGPNPPVKTSESAPVASDFELHPAEAQIGCMTPEMPPQGDCLEPSTAYRYRLVTKNTDGENSSEGQFTTKPPFEILETYASEAGTDGVRLHTAVNPVGIPATAYFEYVDDASYQATGFANAAKTPSANAGSGNTPEAVSIQLASLMSNTTYHYRVIVSNVFAVEAGPERTVTTFPLPAQPTNACPNATYRTGSSAVLPDCRAYEMVSPVDKNGGDVKVLLNPSNFPARLEQSSENGERFAYSSVTAFANARSAPYVSEYLATRTPKGWSTEAINAPRESQSLTDQISMKFDIQYKAFSPDLSEAWLSQDANPPLDECAPEGYMNLYRRDNATGSYEALIPAKPPAGDPLENHRLELQGVSVDGTHSLFKANTKLTPNAANTKGQDAYQLYMHIRDPDGGCGELRLVSFKPNGVASTESASAGRPGDPGEYRSSTVARAISADGSRVFFTLSGNPLINGPIFARVNADQPQSAISAGKCTEPAKGCTLQISAATGEFWTAAADGSRAIYSVGNELFEFDVASALAGEGANTLIAGDLPAETGVVAASEDASRIFFVSEEVIGGLGEAGLPNLYLYEPDKAGAERYRLVATLVGSDLFGQRFWGFAVGRKDPIRNGVRVTADGSHLAFVSRAELTDYDNVDARDGKPNLEIYLYDTVSEVVRCISCNPSGARPRGRDFRESPKDLAADRISAAMPAGQSQSFIPRALSADGSRLFFESYEALLPRDTNGKGDVYGWQRAGSKAECEANGAELYVPSAGGCLSLISTGQSPLDTEIADVSPDGSNVFIRTAESLLPQDPGNVDVYVARVNGGFPQPPPPPAACEGEACQGPLSPPNDPTPASLGFLGAGNVKERIGKPRPRCAKGKTRRKGRCVAKHHKRAGAKKPKAKRRRAP